MQCVGSPKNLNDEWWIALNKDTYQKIFNATLDKMTATNITGNGYFEKEDILSPGGPRSTQPISVMVCRSSRSPSLPLGCQYPAAEIPQVSACVNVWGEPIDLSNKTMTIQSPIEDHGAQTVSNSPPHVPLPTRDQWSDIRSGTRPIVHLHHTMKASIRRSSAPTISNEVPPPLGIRREPTLIQCSKNIVDKLIENVVSNMDSINVEEHEEQLSPTVRHNLTGSIPNKHLPDGFSYTRSKSINNKLTIDAGFSTYQNKECDVRSLPGLTTARSSSPEESRNTSPCWVALSKMYVCDIVESAMNSDQNSPSTLPPTSSGAQIQHNTTGEHGIKKTYREESRVTSTKQSDLTLTQNQSIVPAAKLLREVLQGKRGPEKLRSSTTSVPGIENMKNKKSPSKRRGDLVDGTGRLKRRKNVSKRVSDADWDSPLTSHNWQKHDINGGKYELCNSLCESMG